MLRKVLLVGCITLAAAMLAVGALWLATPWFECFQQRRAEKGVENAIGYYLQAIMRNDKESALDLWDLSAPLPVESEPLLILRRERITDDLLAMGIREYTLLTPEWWRTCCEPGVIADVRNAGGARVQVQVLNSDGQPAIYVFDVFTCEQPYWGDAVGNPPQHWLLRDVYEVEQAPLFWPMVYEATIRYVVPDKGTP